jgi:hypothetical protein
MSLTLEVLVCIRARPFDKLRAGFVVVPKSDEMKSALGVVGAPAFMRGEERFSAPEKVSPRITRFSAGAGAEAHFRQGTLFPLE